MRRRIAVTIAIWALATVPFLDKAFHIDDISFLEIARQIRKDPLRPYSFLQHVDTGYVPAFSIYHPPLLPAYLTLASALDGDRQREVPLHLAVSLFVALAAFSVYGLAERFRCPPAATAFAVVLSPLVVPGTNVMLDVPVLGLFACAIDLFVAGVDRRSNARLVAACVVVGAATLVKYNSAVLLPLLAVYALLHRSPRSTFFLAIPVAIFVAWCVHNELVYGRLHVLAHQIGVADRRFRKLMSWSKLLMSATTGVRMLGAALFCLPLVWRSDRLTVGTALGAALASQLALRSWPNRCLVEASAFLVQGALFVAFGLRLLRADLGALLRRAPRDDATLDRSFLFAWLASVVLFTALFTPFQAARHYVTAVPAIALLAFRETTRRRALAATIPTVLVGLAVAAADMELANAYRTVAHAIGRMKTPQTRNIWFIGHAGWQVYAEREGLTRLGDPAAISSGDLFVDPRWVWKEKVLTSAQTAPFEPFATLRAKRALPLRAFAHWSGFYSVNVQDVPYAYTSEPVLDVFEVKRAR